MKSKSMEKIEQMIKNRWINIAGGLLLLLGVVLFAQHDFASGNAGMFFVVLQFFFFFGLKGLFYKQKLFVVRQDNLLLVCKNQRVIKVIDLANTLQLRKGYQSVQLTNKQTVDVLWYKDFTKEAAAFLKTLDKQLPNSVAKV